MEDAGRWLPAAAVVICAFSWVIVENIRQALEEQWCSCTHSQKHHEMTFTKYSNMAELGRCKRCVCRAFHRDYAH